MVHKLEVRHPAHLQTRLFKFLRETVIKLQTASRKSADKRSSKRISSQETYHKAKTKLESMRKLILDGLDSLDSNCDAIEQELIKLQLDKDIGEVKDDDILKSDNLEKTISPASSPDIVSSDSGFKTDEV